jgi:rfaE bifunctional protein kinase chain/domain
MPNRSVRRPRPALHVIRATRTRRADEPQIDASRLLSLIDACAGRRVAVVGDLMADEFVYGRVERVSREAPVLILRHDATTVTAGGAGNAANNVAALGGRVLLSGLAGRDEEGRRLLDTLHPRVSRRAVIRASGYVTPVKTRILAGGVHSAKQQVVRVDRVANGALPADVRRRVERGARAAAASADAVLVSDYGLGTVTEALVSVLLRVARSAAGQRKPVLMDSRYAATTFAGVTACTPNESEVEQLLGVRIGDDRDTLERAGREMLRRTKAHAVLVTRGGRGMALFEPRQPTRHIPIYGSDEVADVTGAGDTVIATMTLALAAGGTFYEAARLANYAGGLVVMKRGTATVSADELRDAVRRDVGRRPAAR